MSIRGNDCDYVKTTKLSLHENHCHYVDTTDLYTRVRTQVEVKLCGMGDALVDGGSRGNVSRSSSLVSSVGTEQSSVMAFLDDDESDAWLVVHLQLHTRLAYSAQLVTQHLGQEMANLLLNTGSTAFGKHFVIANQI